MRKISITFLLFAWGVAPVQATELSHRFVDPMFGGNPGNGSYILSQAQAQDTNVAPKTPTVTLTAEEKFQANIDKFKLNLQNSILTKLTSSSTSQLFNSNGTIKLGSNLSFDLDNDGLPDFTVNVDNAPDSSGNVAVSVSDGVTNTVLSIPSIVLPQTTQ
ncbi:MAG TPA: hypothetical protein DF614_07535 [Methylococcaceae bacterium]|nr:hypothetical protein [Methylococcaceae bacterium]